MTLLTVAGVTLFIALGMWQLDRAALKAAIKHRFESRLAADYRNFDAGESLVDIEFQKLVLRGRYDTSRSMYLDNQVLRGKAGYHILSPFILSGSGNIVLVDRGWVALGSSREALPVIKLPVEMELARGILSIPDIDGFRLGEVSLRGDWPQVIPFIDIDAMQPRFDNRLLPVLLWMAPEQAGHYQRYWNPAWSDPEKSRAYAVQWFSFALIAFGLYIYLNLQKRE